MSTQTIQRMDHFTVVTDRIEATLAFYEHLGLVAGERPDFGIRGAWLYAGGHPVLHVVEVLAMPTPRRGALDHMAFRGNNIAGLLQILQRERIGYRLLRLPRPWSTWQVFLEDPNGVEVEIDFDATERVPTELKDGTLRP